MNRLHKTTIYARWLDKGYFVLWAEPAEPPRQLIRKLFAYHAPSFYGTFVETEWIGIREMIVLPAVWALDYWTELPVNLHSSFRWSEEVRKYISLAGFLRKMLEQGRFMPDYASWRSGKISWRIAWSERKEAQEASGSEAYSLDDQWLADRWLSQIVNDRIQNREGERLEASWQLPGLERCITAYEKMRKMEPAEWLDEDEWLLTLGWKQDPAPFLLALQLSEPDPAGQWRLSIRVQDRSDPGRAITCAPDGTVIQGICPPDWEPLLEERIYREAQKYMSIAEELRDPDNARQMRQVLDDDLAWLFLMEWSAKFISYGIPILLPAWWERIKHVRPVLHAHVRSPVPARGEGMLGMKQLMQFDWKVSIGDLELSEEEYQRLLQEEKPLISIRGQWMIIDHETLRSIHRRLRKYRREGGMPLHEVLEYGLLRERGHLETQDAPTWREERPLPIEIEWEADLEQFLLQLRRIHEPPLIPLPKQLNGQLRRYQHEGVSWLAMLRKMGFGGCLADDMGLGKTIQWIAYLLHLQEIIKPDRPSLLICPTSVLGNWQKEFARFAPKLRVHLHHGPTRLKGDAFLRAALSADVVITSYALAHIDQQQLTALRWDTVCLDEAQNIKNAYTKQAQAVQKLEANQRAALTGTPLENRLTELWSIMHFVNPGYLGSLRAFSRFARMVEKHQDEARIRRLQTVVRPFLLRREKLDPKISLDLPEKEEMKRYITLTPEQSILYEQQLDRLFRQIDGLAVMERRGAVLSTIMRLKQICDHPALLQGGEDRSTEHLLQQSNKLLLLAEMVEEVRRNGERCIIFTQFIEMGKLLQAVLEDQLNEKVPFMHGSIPKPMRDQMIAAFQQEEQEESGVFILSLKTGGTGLNLTAANHVFHYDRWWNPAVENQASDRVYRIGQQRNVFVHKFISIGTIEEKIDEMLEQKMGLSRRIVGSGEQWISELTNEELREILELRRS